MDRYSRLVRRAAQERAETGYVSFETRRELNNLADPHTWEIDVTYVEEGTTHVGS